MRRRTGHARDRDQETGPLALEELQLICDCFTGGALRLHDAVWLTYFRLHHRQAARYQTGHVFVAGDAAHVHSPAGGQGMNTGIQDACNLGWKLALVARGVADPALLASYESERLPIGRFVLRFTDRASSIATADRRFVRLMRTQVAPRLLPLLLHFRPGRAYAFRAISQLALSYRNSPAVQEGPGVPRAGPRAGDRLPDARIARADQASWLQDAVATPGFHLLLCGPADGWDTDRLTNMKQRYGGLVALHRLGRKGAPGVLHDLDGQAFARLGIDGAAQYLLRPDGHIGYRCGGTELEGVERYLTHWLPGTGRELGRPSHHAPTKI
jgi:hypothetical protein